MKREKTDDDEIHSCTGQSENSIGKFNKSQHAQQGPPGVLKPSPSSNLSVNPGHFLLMSAATMQRDEEGEEAASLTRLTSARTLQVNGREFSNYRAVSQRKWVMEARKPPPSNEQCQLHGRPRHDSGTAGTSSAPTSAVICPAAGCGTAYRRLHALACSLHARACRSGPTRRGLQPANCRPRLSCALLVRPQAPAVRLLPARAGPGRHCSHGLGGGDDSARPHLHSLPSSSECSVHRHQFSSQLPLHCHSRRK